MCSRCANAAVFSPEHSFLLAHGMRSKCDRGVRAQQCCRMNRSSCARREIQLCSRRENAAVFSPEHVTLRTERDPSDRGVRAQQSCCMNIFLSVVCGWRSKWRGCRVCSRSSCPDVLLNMSPRKILCAAGIPRVLG